MTDIAQKTKSKPKSYPQKLRCKICTFNAHKQFRTLVQINNHISFFKQKPQKFDIICLQETGLRRSSSQIPDEFWKNYKAIINYNLQSRNLSATTTLLINPRMMRYFTKQHLHPSGRALGATFEFADTSLCVVCLYLQSGLQSGRKNFSPDSNLYKPSLEICDFVEELRTQHTHIVVCGDFNECYNAERYPKGTFKAPVFIPRITRNVLVDCGEPVKQHTHFFTARNGRRGSSKLDRFLVSPKIFHSLRTCSVITGNPFNSPHRPVVLDFALEMIDTASFPKLPDQPFFHKHLTIYDRSTTALSRICEDLDRTLDPSSIPTTFKSENDLQLGFEHISDTLRKVVRSNTKTTPTSDFHRLFDRSLHQTRGDVRSMKHFITTYLSQTDEPSLSDFHNFSPSRRRYTCERTCKLHGFFLPTVTDISMWEHYVRCITAFAKKLRVRIRQDARSKGLTIAQHRDNLFRSNRSKFYSRFLEGHSSVSYPSRIYDPDSKTVVSEPTKLADTLHREASKLLAQPHPEPQNPPEWFRVTYRYNSKNLDPTIWDVFMSDFSASEVLEAITGDTSPGASGITKLILQIATTETYRENGSPNVTLKYLTRFLNAFLRSRISCQYSSVGLLVLIPKPGKRFSMKYGDKRPLTMINEIPKIAHSILATRLRNILTKHNLLHPANRAYLTGASTYDCNRILVDRLEHSHAYMSFLAGVFYDWSKAFDRLEWWHISFALRRFAMPDAFAEFLFSYLSSAHTYIRTAYGLTQPVDILTSARQGDPLSQYIWQLCIEPLHDRLNVQPYIDSLISFPFSHSLGYSDDTGILSSDPKSLLEMHITVIEFSTTHHMVLNGSKIESFAIHGTDSQLPVLADNAFSVDGHKLTFPNDHTWYYLGMTYSTDLDWSHHCNNLESKYIIPTAAKISSGDFTLENIQFIYREKILSRVTYTSQLIFIPPNYLRRWDTYLYRAIRKALPRTYQSVTQDGLYHLLRICRLEDLAPVITLSEMLIHLNSESVSSALERTRVQQYVQLDGTLLPEYRDHTVYGRTLNFWIRKGVRISLNLQSHNFQNTVTPMLPDLPNPWSGITVGPRDTIEVYTDASIVSGRPISGVSSVTTVHSRVDDQIHARQIATSCSIDVGGCPFVGEALGVIRILESSPQALIQIFTDCKQFVDGVKRFPSLPARQQLRTQYRSIFRHVCRILDQRQAPTELDYIPREDNTIADRIAKSARKHPTSFSPNLLVGEERYVLYDRDSLVLGDYSRHLKHTARDEQFQRWTEKSFQGRVARYVNSPTYNFSTPTAFQVNLLTSTLPTGRVIQHSHHTPSTCPFCSLEILDDTRHFFCCPATVNPPFSLPQFSTTTTYGTHHSPLPYLLYHLPNPQSDLGPATLSHLANLFLIHYHKLNLFISPFTFRMCIDNITSSPIHPPLPPNITGIVNVLQKTFCCTIQFCRSVLDLSPHTYRWDVLDGSHPAEIGSFDFFHHPPPGSFLISFPLDPTENFRILNHIQSLHNRLNPYRFVIFTNVNTQLPPWFDDYLTPSRLPIFKFYLIQNPLATRTLPIDLENYSSYFTKPYPNLNPIFPRLPTPADYLSSLNSFSRFFWLPELSLICISPPTIDMAQQNFVSFESSPLELRVLGLPTLSTKHVIPPTVVESKLHNIFQRLYRRRTLLWQRYCSSRGKIKIQK